MVHRGRTAPRILNAEPGRLSEKARAALRSLGTVVEVDADRDYLLSNVDRYDVIFIALRNAIDREVLRRATSLRCIVTVTTGLSHIDVSTAREKGITVLSLQGETEFLSDITATAELTWGLLLCLMRKIPAAHADVIQGRWERNDHCGMQLKDKTLGILGYGRLGKMVAAYGRAFRMSVIAFDRNPEQDPCIEIVPFTELLRRSDIVSIHLPLTEDTRSLLGEEAIRLMKPGALLINTARGEIVDEAALADALSAGRLGGAAVDVLANEIVPSRRRESPLIALARASGAILITPHIGGVTYESVEQTNLFMIAKLRRYLETKGQPLAQ